jgi:hypothetical protein
MKQPVETDRPIDRIYHYIFEEEEDARVCTDIPEAACQEVPRNFFKIGAAQTLTRLADELSNAKTVLPWLLGAIGASPLWIGLLVPVRESLSMLPQLIIAGIVRRCSQRKKIWLLGALLQSSMLVGLAVTAVTLRGAGAGALVVGLLVLFSLARGLCSVASKDVIGKTTPKTRRGRLTGFTAALGGTLTLGAGLAMVPWVGQETDPVLFALLFGFSAALWLVAAWVYARIVEVPGATEGGRNALREALKRLSILRTDPAFRRFVLVRALLISTALSGPYYVVLARESGGGGELLGFFVLASGLASALSSAFWGRYSDRSSRSVLIVAAAAASGLGVLLFLLNLFGLLQTGFGWIAPVAFFVLSIAHSGVRIGRKTYILDLAGGSRRTDYVAVSNTVIGAILLASGLLGMIGAMIGAAGMLLVLSIFGFLGVIYGMRLPEVE